MRRKIKSILIVVGVIFTWQICTFCSNGKKEDLPQMPDVQNVSEALKEQIVQANEAVNKKWSADNLGYLGMVYYSSNYYDEAVACFQLAANKTRSDWQWDYYLAYLNLELGESEKAVVHLVKILDMNPDVTLVSYRLADVYRQQNKNEEAKGILTELLERRLSDFRLPTTQRTVYYQLPVYARYLLSRIYSEEKNYVKAEAELKTIIGKEKTFGPAYKQLGLIYSLSGDSVKGEQCTMRSNDLALYIDPVDTLMDRLTLMSKSDIYLLKQVDNAMNGFDSKWTYTVLNVAIRNIPENKYVVSKVVEQMMEMGLGKMVISYLDIQFNNFKDSWSEMQKTAIALADAGFVEESKRFFLQAQKCDPTTLKAKTTLAGLMNEKAGLATEAENWMRELIDANPNDKDVLSDGAFLYVVLNKLNLAKKYLERLRKLDPASAKVFSIQGSMELQKGNKERAILFFEKAFQIEVDNPFVVTQLGEYYQEEKEWGKAISFYEEAIKVYPNKSDIQERLGALLIASPDKELVDVPRGLEYAERAYYNSVYTLPVKVWAARTLAIGYYKLGNRGKTKYYIDEAITLAQKSQFSPSYIQSLNNLARQLEAK